MSVSRSIDKAHVTAQGAGSARVEPAAALDLVDADTFLERRRPFVEYSNRADDLSRLLDFVCLLSGPTIVIPAACAIAAGITGIDGLLAEAAVSEIGSITQLRIREVAREGNSHAIRVTLPPGGISLLAHMTVQRQVNPSGPLVFAASLMAKLTAIIPLVSGGIQRQFVEVLDRLSQLSAELQRQGLLDMGIPISDETVLGPIDFRHVLAEPGGTSQPFGLPLVTVSQTGRATPLALTGLGDFNFSLKQTVATIQESALSYRVYFHVRSSLTGTWSGTYRYGANCGNWVGIETLELTENLDGNITGTITDALQSPVVLITSGSVVGNHNDNDSTVSLVYRCTSGIAAGQTTRFIGTVVGNSMTGVGGNCGGGTTFTLTRQPRP